jgi:hypothetical protein
MRTPKNKKSVSLGLGLCARGAFEEKAKVKACVLKPTLTLAFVPRTGLSQIIPILLRGAYTPLAH